MKITDLYTRLLQESQEVGPEQSLAHHMPTTVAFPDLDPYYDFYRFVVAMAGQPDPEQFKEDPKYLKNIPVAVAYTDAERDMIEQVARHAGIKHTVLTLGNSRELPDTNTRSPVARRGKMDD